MSISYGTETYDQIIDELHPMLFEHWKELAVYKDIPLAPDFDFYRDAARRGRIMIYTAREHDGTLIGYSIFAVHPSHPHYTGIAWAANDIIWLRPDYRRQGIGGAFQAFWDAKLTELGMTLVVIDTKVTHPELMYMLKAGGYTTRSCGMEKRLR